MNILLVDDETSVIQVIGDFLTECGHCVIPAGDGAEALNTLEARGDIALIVSDIRMPRMDGIEFLRAVRVRFPGTPVILITGHGDEGVAVSALQEGAYDYLKKPVKLGEFLACVEGVEERNRLEAQTLKDYQSLLRNGQVSGSAWEWPGTQSETNATIEDLRALEALWDTLRDHLTAFRPVDASEQRQLSFILDEGSGLLSGLQARIRRLAERMARLKAMPQREDPAEETETAELP